MHEEDQSREGVTIRKFIQLFQLLIPKNTKTLAVFDKFTDLSLEKIKDSKIKGIILDVDGCIAYNHKDIFPENATHIKKLVEAGVKFVIYSNAKKTNRYDVLPKAVKVLTNLPPKPEKAGFETALKELGVDKKNVIMIGDNFITDGGAIQYGIPFIRIKPLRDKNEGFFERAHALFRSFFIVLSNFYNLFRG